MNDYARNYLTRHLADLRQRVLEASAELVTLTEERDAQQAHVDEMKGAIIAIEATLRSLGVDPEA